MDISSYEVLYNISQKWIYKDDQPVILRIMPVIHFFITSLWVSTSRVYPYPSG